MTSFSYGAAIGAGFRVIGRRPLAPLVWALAYLLFVGAPTVFILAHVLPNMLAGLQEMAHRAGPPDRASLLAMRARTFGWQPLIWLLALATNTVLMGAVFRAVLEPQNSRWAYLRLSSQELWLGLTYLVMAVIGFIMVLVLTFPIAICAGILAAIAEHGGSALGGAALLTVVGIAGVGVIFWVLLRLCLALPMSFSQARFTLYESWDLTRGQAFKIFLVYLVLALGVALVEAVIVATFAVGVRPHFDGWASLGDYLPGVMETVRRLAPAIAAFVVVASVIGMTIRAILVAPLAEIYRELTETPPPAP